MRVRIGVRTARAAAEGSGTALGRPAGEGESPVGEARGSAAGSRVPRGTRNPVGRSGDHPARLNTTWRPIEQSTVKER